MAQVRVLPAGTRGAPSSPAPSSLARLILRGRAAPGRLLFCGCPLRKRRGVTRGQQGTPFQTRQCIDKGLLTLSKNVKKGIWGRRPSCRVVEVGLSVCWKSRRRAGGAQGSRTVLPLLLHKVNRTVWGKIKAFIEWPSSACEGPAAVAGLDASRVGPLHCREIHPREPPTRRCTFPTSLSVCGMSSEPKQ